MSTNVCLSLSSYLCLFLSHQQDTPLFIIYLLLHLSLTPK